MPKKALMVSDTPTVRWLRSPAARALAGLMGPTLQEVINALPPLPGRPRKNFRLVLMARNLQERKVPLTSIGAVIIACRDGLPSVQEAETKYSKQIRRQTARRYLDEIGARKSRRLSGPLGRLRG